MENKSIEYVRTTLGLAEDEQLGLHHWLRVLSTVEYPTEWLANDETLSGRIDGTFVVFNLTTGQPASESDYRAFNEIIRAEEVKI